MPFEGENMDIVKEINSSSKEYIKSTIMLMRDEIDSGGTWNNGRVDDFIDDYFDLLKEIDVKSGITKLHQENEGFVHFDFDPVDLIKINDFVKSKIIPRLEKRLKNPDLNKKDKKEIEKDLKELNNANVFLNIYAAGSYKQENA
ncbi:MAG: hypothetical protein WCF92_00935 [bacterium]